MNTGDEHRTLIRLAGQLVPLLELFHREHAKHLLHRPFDPFFKGFRRLCAGTELFDEPARRLGFDRSQSFLLIGGELQRLGDIRFAERSRSQTLQRDLTKPLPLLGTENDRQRGFVFASDRQDALTLFVRRHFTRTAARLTRPFRTLGSYWPSVSTIFDYVRRAMPFGNAQSLSNDELYAVTAYLLRLNDIIKDDKFELTQKNFTSIRLPNAAGFFDDDREVSEKAFWKGTVCMADCKAAALVLNRARSLDVTPPTKAAPNID